jgi:hypothetical protein
MASGGQKPPEGRAALRRKSAVPVHRLTGVWQEHPRWHRQGDGTPDKFEFNPVRGFRPGESISWQTGGRPSWPSARRPEEQVEFNPDSSSFKPAGSILGKENHFAWICGTGFAA